MKSARARGMVLQFFQSRVGGPLCRPRPDDFDGLLNFEEIFRACESLDEHGLIEWKAIRRLGGSSFGCGRITPEGLHVIEGQTRCPLDIAFPCCPAPAFAGAAADLNHHLRQIRQAIETCDEDSIAETRRQICALLSHPRLNSDSSPVLN